MRDTVRKMKDDAAIKIYEKVRDMTSRREKDTITYPSMHPAGTFVNEAGLNQMYVGQPAPALNDDYLFWKQRMAWPQAGPSSFAYRFGYLHDAVDIEFGPENKVGVRDGASLRSSDTVAEEGDLWEPMDIGPYWHDPRMRYKRKYARLLKAQESVDYVPIRQYAARVEDERSYLRIGFFQALKDIHAQFKALRRLF